MPKQATNLLLFCENWENYNITKMSKSSVKAVIVENGAANIQRGQSIPTELTTSFGKESERIPSYDYLYRKDAQPVFTGRVEMRKGHGGVNTPALIVEGVYALGWGEMDGNNAPVLSEGYSTGLVKSTAAIAADPFTAIESLPTLPQLIGWLIMTGKAKGFKPRAAETPEQRAAREAKERHEKELAAALLAGKTRVEDTVNA